MVSKSHFVLHSRVVPPLTAGDYVLEADQKITDATPDQAANSAASFPTEPYRGHLRVNSPRYRMPPDQILSTFPPANSEGAYESRLPQIVLKRRTLPWERKADADTKIPWLALVVIAEGEGAISAESPIADCVTPGIKLNGPNDTPTGVYLSIPQTTLDKVFPTKEDLQLLVHVREVDLGDTELAMGDDDGFLSVVIANRLPQFDRVGCKPVRYLACLVNLEEQVKFLPPPVQPRDHFFPGDIVFQADAKALLKVETLDKVLMGEPVINPAMNMQAPVLGGAIGAPGAPAMRRAAAQGAAMQGVAAAGGNALLAASATSAKAGATSDQWSTKPKTVEDLAVSAHAKEAGSVVREAMGVKFRIPIDAMTRERIYRFPVLTYWSFTCDGGGSFETLMRNLDVGMLGTVAGRPSGKEFPLCFQPRGGSAPPDVPPSRPAAELAETGHVGLPHQTRRGEALRAWYRGPLVPNLTVRETAPPGGHLPLSHVSDQLRRLVPDGREDLAYACAFEIGRMLALSHPSVVAALTRWRTEQFGAARAKRFSDVLTANAAFDFPNLAAKAIRTLGEQINRRFVELAAETPGKMLGNSRPLVDPGRPIESLSGDVSEIIATGFGLGVESVRVAMRTGDFSVLETVAVPSQMNPEMQPQTLGHLSQALDSVLEQLTNDALPAGLQTGTTTRGARPGRGRAPAAAPERSEAEERGSRTLETLLRETARRKREEDGR
ncbi:MAG TPA: hypothetical protein VFE34_16345 [Dongiaceae bacterium]|nr:hypothetical protein [Dongiaceae bacterium]